MVNFEQKVQKVLLLTYKECDNIGDQLIEETSKILLQSVFDNLKIGASIDSQDISKVTIEQLKVYNLVVFGGGGIIKYKYQNFYKHISSILYECNFYNIPVIFSGVGVEDYDEKNDKCIQLKEALNLPCVKQVATRDDIENLQNYIDSKDINIAKVADPATFCKYIYDFKKNTKKTIGLCVVRDGIFESNEKEWGIEDEMGFWIQVIENLQRKGYNYKLFSTGHFNDEVFLDQFIKKYNLSKDCKYPVFTRDQLFDVMEECEGIIAFRLHCGIVSYSFEIPCVNLSWNDKVRLFYRSVGKESQSLEFKDWNEKLAIDTLFKAIGEFQEVDNDYIFTNYEQLFNAVNKEFSSSENIWTFEKLVERKDFKLNRLNIEEVYEKANMKINYIEYNYKKVNSKYKYLLSRSILKFIPKPIKKVARTILHKNAND
jgi:polysaccharide pyruvyl transferase WcaK-like protein